MRQGVMPAPTSSFSFTPQPAGSPFSFSNISSQPSSSKQPSFAFSKPNGQSSQPLFDIASSDVGDDDMGGNDEEDDGGPILHLEPAAYKRSGKAKWKNSGRGMMAAVNPNGGEIAAWIGLTVRPFPSHRTIEAD